VNGTPSGTTHLIHDKEDRLIAETDGAGTIVREYVWAGDVPVAVLDGTADPANPTLLWVYADHLKRPEIMTDAAGAVVWKALYEPFGAVHSITGPAANDGRFPGQWFQLETGLHYNWHRHYDPSLGRYTQPDPLAVNLPGVGPSLYAYAGNSPLMNVDPDGRQPIIVRPKPAFPPSLLPPRPSHGPLSRPWWWEITTHVTRFCRSFIGSGSDPRRSEPGCEEEWQEAEEFCRDELAKPSHTQNRRLTGGHRDIYNCARGLVSERCGGNPVQRR
jgi:RHS repeat-associated protein